MTLQLLICTFNEGILRIPQLLLPPIPGVGYLVSWQQTSDFTPSPLPEAIAGRKDVEVVTLPGIGLSRNRNHCFSHASADVCLICDDDCRYTAEGLRAVTDTFEQNPCLDLAAFKAKIDSEPKCYPPERFNLRQKKKGFYPISFELAFRRKSVVGKVKFDERFGLGAERFGAGEESIFVDDAIKAGLTCEYFPLQVVEHLGATTSVTRRADEKVLRAGGAVLWRCFRSTMWLRLPLLAWRTKRATGVTFAYAFTHLRSGIREMKKAEAK